MVDNETKLWLIAKLQELTALRAAKIETEMEAMWEHIRRLENHLQRSKG